MSLFTWGEHADRGLIKSDVVDSQGAFHFVCSQNEIRCVSAGKAAVAFLRGDGKLSIFRTQEEDGKSKAGKLSESARQNESLYPTSRIKANTVCFTCITQKTLATSRSQLTMYAVGKIPLLLFLGGERR